jgi:hypothetical protein
VNRRRILTLALLLSTISLATTLPLSAQSGKTCFLETGYCISGRIREFWAQNGGLMVFGYPITPLQEEKVEGRSHLAQWFERARLELHPDTPPPYDVLLGRLGPDRLTQQRRAWQRFGKTPAAPDCQLFPETGHAVCGEFLAAWQANGLQLDDDPAPNGSESLALFGLPLSSPQIERLSDGRQYVVQWFERARFELHPEHEPPFRVLFGLLGRELSPRASEPPARRFSAPPARLVIESIDLDRTIIPVGFANSGDFVVPDHDIGWYDQSALPGQGSNVVLWAHVLPFLSAPQIPAPFARLKELPVGTPIRVYDQLGQMHEYAIAQQIEVLPDQTEFLLPQGREIVTMISCTGDGIVVAGGVVDMTRRLITLAEPVR